MPTCQPPRRRWRGSARTGTRFSTGANDVFTFAHTDPYLGLDVDTPRAAALFGDCHYFDVGRYRACRARHRRLVFVLK